MPWIPPPSSSHPWPAKSKLTCACVFSSNGGGGGAQGFRLRRRRRRRSLHPFHLAPRRRRIDLCRPFTPMRRHTTTTTTTTGVHTRFPSREKPKGGKTRKVLTFEKKNTRFLPPPIERRQSTAAARIFIFIRVFRFYFLFSTSVRSPCAARVLSK